VAQLIDALAAKADRNLRSGNDRRATDYLQHASRLAALTRQDKGDAMARMRARSAKALDARLAHAEAEFNRADAFAAVEMARGIGLAPATIAGFKARADKIPQPGDTLADDHMRLVRVGDRVIAAATSDVSRADYAHFALSTGRPASLCRERTSLLRLLAPRSWKSPGFSQSAAHPVVCVSWSDAEAYAQWLGKRDGHHYRLPSAAEARLLPSAGAATPVATWLGECASECSERLSTGHSWRGASGTRPLDANRGYDDVGFRLVRDQ
jgi:formylglycine-generating enzyme required for sulfatase activity